MSPDDLRRVLRLAPHLSFSPHPPSGAAFLVGERERHAVRNADVARVIAAASGGRDAAQIVDACSDTVPAGRVMQILARLEEQGVLVEAAAGEPAHLAFAAGLRIPHVRARVEVVPATEDGEAARAMAAALSGAGFEVAPTEEGTRVIVATDYLSPRCVEAGRAARRAGRPFFLVKPGGLRPFVGPLFTGGEGEPCPDCLSHALREQRPVEQLLQRAAPGRDWPSPPAAALPASLAAAAGLAAVRLRTALSLPGPGSMSGRLWTLDLARFELEEHRVRRRPQCPSCGDPGLQARIGERPVTLAPAPIAFSADGGFRREPPDATFARLRHLVSPVLGPVTHLHPMPGRHTDAHPVFSAGYLAVPRGDAAGDAFDRPCAGKGTTASQARASALAEAIERSSGLYRGDEAVTFASAAELGEAAILPGQLQLFSAAQEARGAPAPPRLPEGARIAWTPAWSLADGARRYVPLACCYSEAPLDTGAVYCRPSSNGSAAGNCLEEAVLQGLFELVERDAAAIWWYARARRPGAPVPPSSAPVLEAQRAVYEALGWSLWALDLTHDVGLPVVVAVAVHAGTDRFALGFGCHSDADLALRRALSELHQVFDPGRAVPSPWDGMAASELPYLWPDPAARPAERAPAPRGRDLKDHVEAWVARLRALGLDTIVVDKTRPDMGLHVAQVLVPGLRHVWPRFAPGRLTTVPVALGWIPRPLSEEELNPSPLLI